MKIHVNNEDEGVNELKQSNQDIPQYYRYKETNKWDYSVDSNEHLDC